MEIIYRDLVFGQLLKMEESEVLISKVKPENRNKFIFAIKEIIDRGIDKANGIEIEFSPDYSKVRKRKVFKRDTLRTWITKVRKDLELDPPLRP